MKQKKMKNKIYRGFVIHSIEPEVIEAYIDGAIVVDGEGKISACGEFAKMKKKFPVATVKDHRGKVIMPGLIDCHIHLPQLDQRGKHGATLLGWLDKYIFPAERAFKSDKVARDVARRFFKKLILNGTTTSLVLSTIHAKATNIAFGMARDSGLRVFMGKTMMDQHSPAGLLEDLHTSLNESIALCDKWNGAENGRLKYAFTPRFAPTCSEALWENVGRLAAEAGAFIHTHVAETHGENLRMHELFPDYNDYIELFEETGCLGPKMLLTHAIYLSESEFHRIAAAHGKVIHCPSSNLFLKSGRMPVEIVEGSGITYGLGTDVGAGASMSLFTTMRHADYVQPKVSITPRKAFYLATLGGAKVLSMGDSIGNFAVGKAADFNVVDIHGIDPRYKLSELDADEFLSLVMYRGGGRVISECYVQGKKLDVDAL